MNKKNFRRGLTIEATLYDHLRGRLDSEALLDDLGIDFGFRQGRNQIMAHCPNLTGNHKNGDANPSFGFNEDKLAFNCFVCGSGNIVELVQMMHPGTSDEDAVEYLERFSDLTPLSQEDLVSKVQSILYPPQEDEQVMPDYPLDNLFQYRKIHPYLYERGISKDIIVEMQVGFDEQHCGIVIPHLFMGKLRGWQTRHLVEDPKGVYHCEAHSCNFKGEKKIPVPKYKNTPHFPKINTLYGYDRFKQKMREKPVDWVLVVESPMTALKLMSMGIDYVVATFGQFSVEQGMLLLAVPHVLFWPDNDKAGYENALRCIDSLGRYTQVKIVPVIDEPKGDAANLDELLVVEDYMRQAYNSALFPMVAKDGLPTLNDIQVLNTEP